MAGALPQPITDYLLRRRLVEERAAFLRLAPDGSVREAGGDLAAHNLSGEIGRPAEEHLGDLLMGLLPLPDPMVLPAMELAPGEYADLHLIPDEGGCWTLVLDVSEAARTEQALQQSRLDLRLLRDELAERNQALEEANLRIAAANQAMRKNLEAAAQIQQALLPTAPPAVEGVSFEWAFQPCDELAGDILNVFALEETLVAFYLLDVSGHGVPAALLSVTLSRMLAPHRDPTSQVWLPAPGEGGVRAAEPTEVAAGLNRRFQLDRRTEQFFTLFYGLLDTSSWELRFVSAGHPAPVHLTGDGALREPGQPDLPIGLLDQVSFQEQRLSLEPGDRLFLYSDGLVEAADGRQRLFGEDRLKESIQVERGRPLAHSVATLVEAVRAWCGGKPQDDVSVLALERSRR